MKKMMLFLVFYCFSLLSFELKVGLTKDYLQFKNENEIISRDFGVSIAAVYSFNLIDSLCLNIENQITINWNQFGKYPDTGVIYNSEATPAFNLELPIYLNYQINSYNQIHLGLSFVNLGFSIATAKIYNPENKPILDFDINMFFINPLIGYKVSINSISFELRFNYGLRSIYSNKDGVLYHKFDFLFGYIF